MTRVHNCPLNSDIDIKGQDQTMTSSILMDLNDNFLQRRTGMAEEVDTDALKKSLKRSKKVKSQDTMSIESWKSTSSRGNSDFHVYSDVSPTRVRTRSWVRT